jgi:hypothetical protein
LSRPSTPSREHLSVLFITPKAYDYDNVPYYIHGERNLPGVDLVKLATDLIGPFLEVWAHRNETKAAKEAATLMFWRDGMLESLRMIAAGQATKATFSTLKRELQETEAPVQRAMQSLRATRGKLGGSNVARQIDLVLHHNEFGKGSIRDNIWMILKHHGAGDVSYLAQDTCDSIEAFNAEIGRLRRMVYPS